MKLRALRVYDVRQFAGRGVALAGISDGLNSFAEPNETGKSTLFAALHAVVFEKFTSGGKAIQSLRPYAGGNPRIALDLETAEGTFRIEKRFTKGPAFARVTDLGAGQVIARADEAQVWIERLLGTGDAGSGPAGLLWVQQGDSGSLSGGNDARAGSLNAMVAGQLDAMTVGTRMQAVMERTADELNALLTPQGKPRNGGALAVAEADVKELAALEASLAARHEALRRDLDLRQRLRRDLAERNEDARDPAAEQAKITKAEETARAAQARAAKIPALEANARTLGVQLEAAGRDRSEFTQACRQAADAQTRISDLETAMQGLEAGLAARKDALDTASGAQEAARANVQQAEQSWQRAMDARRRDEIAGRLADRQAALAKAREQAEADRTARAGAALITLDAERLEALTTLQQSSDRAYDRAMLSRTSVEIDYVPGAEGRISVDGKALGMAQRLDITAPLDLVIPQTGTVRISPGGADQASAADQDARGAAQALAAALAQEGVSDLATARAQLSRKTELLQQAGQALALVQAYAPEGLDALADEVARLGTALGALDEHEAPDPEAGGAILGAAREALAAADRAEVLAKEAYGEAQRMRQKTSTEQAAIAETLSAALVRTGPQDQWSARADSLDGAVQDLARQHAGIAAELDTLAGAADDAAFAEADLARLRKSAENRRDEVQRIELELARVDERFRDAADDGIEGALSTTREALAAARARYGAVDLKARALQRLDRALKEAHRSMRETYFAPVNRELRPLLNRVLGGETLEFDGDLTPHTLRRNGQEEEITRLSGGTQEQVAILTRLAFARLLAQKDNAAPVVLDDALIFSDDDRIEQMFTVLNAMTTDLQIIVLTCRQRAFAGMGGTVLTLQDWVPEDE